MSRIPKVQSSVIKGHEGSVMAVRFNADGNYCFTCGRDRLVKLWNPSTGMLLKTYKGHGNDVNDVVGAYDNSKFVSGGADRQVVIWDVGTGHVIRKFRGHTHTINCLKINEEGTIVVSGSYDATVRIWDCRSQDTNAIQVLNEAADSVPSIDLTAYEILTGSVDSNVRTYDIRAGQLRTDFLNSPVTSVRFSHDHACILASTLDNTIRLLDKDKGELFQEYSGHKNAEYKIDSRLSYDDAYVVSGSEDGRICYWDLVDGKMSHSMAAHQAVVCSIDYHPRKHLMLSASVDGEVKFWTTEE